MDAAIPAMLLQPLLENAYKHGVERSSTPVHIQVDARRDDARLHISIRNTGPLRESRTPGIGLINGRERLALIYADARLDLRADSDSVVAQVELPWQRYTE
jgi:LytS/YehU family sensor histidine kinase